MKFLIMSFLALLCTIAFSQDNAVGIFQNHADIGNPKYTGDARYNDADQSYTLKGGGYNITLA